MDQWTRPFYGRIIKLVHFMDLLLNSSTLWTKELVHFMDVLLNPSTIWTYYIELVHFVD